MEKILMLKQVAEEIKSCETCREGKSGLPVPGEGDPDAKVVFIGEAPGKEEAKTGRPFVGRAGRLLRELIAKSGLKEDEVFITSPVKFFPDRGTPTPEDIAHGKVHLQKQLEIIDPQIIVLLGRVAALAVLDQNIAVAKEHGKVIEKEGRKFFISYHPAAPLHNPYTRVELLKDFKKLKKLL